MAYHCILSANWREMQFVLVLLSKCFFEQKSLYFYSGSGLRSCTSIMLWVHHYNSPLYMYVWRYVHECLDVYTCMSDGLYYTCTCMSDGMYKSVTLTFTILEHHISDPWTVLSFTLADWFCTVSVEEQCGHTQHTHTNIYIHTRTCKRSF